MTGQIDYFYCQTTKNGILMEACVFLINYIEWSPRSCITETKGAFLRLSEHTVNIYCFLPVQHPCSLLLTSFPWFSFKNPDRSGNQGAQLSTHWSLGMKSELDQSYFSLLEFGSGANWPGDRKGLMLIYHSDGPW